MIIATTDLIYGKNCEPLGLVSGNIVQSTNLVKDFGAGLKSLVGGELKAYTQMMIEARASAEQRMIEEAQRLGADAIVGMRYMSAAITPQAAEVLAYGTAVKFV